MSGDRRIVLTEILPGEDTPTGVGPERTGRIFRVRARVSFLGGRDDLEDMAVVSESKARWRVRQVGIKALTPKWSLTDDLGSDWRITAITEPPGQRGIWYDIHTERVE